MSISSFLPEALENLHKLSLREEMDSFDGERFVDFRLLSQLETHDWQVIFGRRGAGKTMLLNAFGDYIARKESDSYCLYIDMRSCIPSASGYAASISDEHRAVEYFYEFVRKFASQLFDEYTDTTNLSPLQRVIRKFSGNTDLLDSLVLDIHGIAEYPPLRKVPVSSTTTSGAGSKSNTQGGVSTMIGVESSLADGKVDGTGSLGGDVQHGRENSSSSTESTDYVFQSARRYQPLRKKLEEMMRAVEVKHLYVLIDEWADINRLKDDRIQVYFAELLRKTFGGSSLITIKIASIKGVSKFNEWREQGGIGLELGADMFVACDLDQVYHSEENSHAFYSEMMFKRLCKVDSRIRQFSKTNDMGEFTGKPPEGFFSYIFKDDKSLMDIVRGSGRIPRDFIQLFCACAHEKHFSIAPLWRRGELLSMIRDHSIRTKDEIVGARKGRRELFQKILSVAKATGSRTFLVSKNCNLTTLSAVNELYNFRLIHPIDPSRIPSALRKEYHFYHTDLGYFLEAYSEFETLELAPLCPMELDQFSAEIKRYVVEMEQIESTSVSCHHCGQSFASSEPSFVKKGYCPHCFNVAVEEELSS